MKRGRKNARLSTMEPMLVSPGFLQQHQTVPEQVDLEILSRLPVQSLLRFRCVCKAWKSHISDPKFTLSPARKPRIAIQCRYFYSIDTEHAFPGTIRLSRRVPLLKPIVFHIKNKTKKRFKILGSCNGLFLVSYLMRLYLWNPSTRQSAKVVSLRRRKGNKDFTFEAYSYPTGLCYDSSTDDYKAVMANKHQKVTIFSFKRKCCATVTIPSQGGMYGIIALRGPIVNEKLHWTLDTTGPKHNWKEISCVVCYDPRSDKFEELPMPRPTNNEPKITGLGVLDGFLCMARWITNTRRRYDPGPGFFELSVMKEYGVGGSWTRILSVATDGRVLSRPLLVPLCFTSEGEVVISVPELGKLCAYNLEDNSQRDDFVPGIGVPSIGVITYTTSYTESFVSPEAYRHEEDWILEVPKSLK